MCQRGSGQRGSECSPVLTSHLVVVDLVVQHQVPFHLGPAGGGVATQRADHVLAVLLLTGPDVLPEGRALQVAPPAERTGRLGARPHALRPLWRKNQQTRQSVCESVCVCECVRDVCV